jgi:hypothetical protein
MHACVCVCVCVGLFSGVCSRFSPEGKVAYSETRTEGTYDVGMIYE